MLMITVLAGCSVGSGNQPTAPVIAAAPPPSAMVRQVQDRLQRDGYYRQGPLDGFWGSGTIDAVAQFQRDHRLNASGRLDVPTLEALEVTPTGDGQTAER
jgi:peptidoglycan hydrolase-like protein with peptidoglycan-binding domain